MSTAHSHEPDWVHGHPHEPNPAPPGEDASFSLILPNGTECLLTLEALQTFPFCEIENCMIISTGHGASGPFRFGGVRLLTLLQAFLPADQTGSYVDVKSADNFGTRIRTHELLNEPLERTTILAWQLEGNDLTRQRGLVRLIVPSEVDDALKQVKWVARVEVFA